MEQESTKDLVIVRKTIWLVRMINQAWSVGHCKDTIINRMLMTKDRQWTPHRIEAGQHQDDATDTAQGTSEVR